MIRLFGGVAGVAAALSLSIGVASAQAPYPSKPINLIVPSAPGGSSDIGARIYADVISRILNQRVIVENKNGAGGIVAAQYLQTVPADGYTIGQTLSGLHEIIPSAGQLPFNPNEDFTLITPLFTSDNFLIARADLPANSPQELVAYGKANPKSLTFGDTSIGAPPNLMMEIFRNKAGMPIEMVHYGSSVVLLNDMIAGRLDVSGTAYASFRSGWDLKKVKILAINGEQRSPRFPQYPTLAEAGYPGVYVATWWGLMGPKGLPKPVVDKLNETFAAASKDPELVQKMEQADIRPITMPSDQFTAMAKANLARYSALIKEYGIKIQ